MEPATILILAALAAVLLTKKKSSNPNAALVAETIPEDSWGILNAALSPSVVDDGVLMQLQTTLLAAAQNQQTSGNPAGAWRLNQFAMAIQAKRNAVRTGVAVDGSNLEAIKAIALAKMPAA
jgi:hypothetical protein